MGRSITTNKALRAKDERPQLSAGRTHDVTCKKCGGFCIPEELTITKDRDSAMFRHRVDVLMRCVDCKTGQFLIIMPDKEGAPLDLFVDVLA
jgi:hypothetical protein